MILITGHRGFIGQHLCRGLDKRWIKWVGYDIVDGQDIRNLFQLDNFFKDHQFDKVIHLAAMVGVRSSTEFPDEYITTNIIGTQNIISCCKKYDIKKLIHFSSSSVYGNNPPHKEEDRLEPISIYAITKMAGEKLVQISGLPSATIIRPFTVYGENGRRDQVIYKWINQIKKSQPITFLGNGKTRRGYTYVNDLVSGVLVSLDNLSGGVSIYNLGGTEIKTLEDLLHIFQTVLHSFKVNYLPLPGGDVVETWANIDKAEKELGYNPQPNFCRNIESIIKKEFNL